jgi:hypothetical protein
MAGGAFLCVMALADSRFRLKSRTGTYCMKKAAPPHLLQGLLFINYI